MEIGTISEEVLDLEKCIKLYAQTVSKIAKCLSNQQKASQFTAKNATQSIESFS